MGREATREVYKRGERWWGVFPGDDRRSLKLSADAPRSEAVKRRAEWIARSHPRRSTVTLEEALEAFILELGRRGRSEATIEIAKRKSAHFKLQWGATMPLEDVDGRLVADYIRTREGHGGRHGKRVQPLTIRRELDVLRGALKLAVHHGRFARPIETVMPIEYSPRYEPRRRWLRTNELQKLLAKLTMRRRVWIALAIGAGARRSEVTRIERKHVDIKRGIVKVEGTKTKGAFDDVPITELQRPWLEFALEHGRKRGPLAHRWPMVSRDLDAACAHAKIERVTTNDFRRTLGHWLRHAGVPPHLIGRVLRHRDSTMAELVYATGDVHEVKRLLAEYTVRQTVRKPGRSRHSGHARHKRSA